MFSNGDKFVLSVEMWADTFISEFSSFGVTIGSFLKATENMFAFSFSMH